MPASAEKTFYVYILANRHRTIYVGMTNDLQRRIHEHKHRLVPGFTSRYGIDRLVYFESGGNALGVIAREKELKGWRRSRKVSLIEQENPEWRDLSEDWD